MEIWGDISLVYWPEHAIQAGAWTAFALPPGDLHDGAARQRAYELLNLCYQVGVFFSRSSGNLTVLRTLTLTLTRTQTRTRPLPLLRQPDRAAHPNPNPNLNPNPNPNLNPNPSPSPSPSTTPTPAQAI